MVRSCVFAALNCYLIGGRGAWVRGCVDEVGGGVRGGVQNKKRVSFCMDLFDIHFHQICDGLLNALRGRRSSY